MRALEEADEFAFNNYEYGSELRLRPLVDSHRTPVLRNADLSKMTALLAMQHYYQFAHEQLALATHHEPVASKSLYGLGCLANDDRSRVAGESSGGPKAIAFYHAAVACDPLNSTAANELGVMLAQAGQLTESLDVLHHAVSVHPNPVTINNLAEVHRRMGNLTAAMEIQNHGFASPPEAGRTRGTQNEVLLVDHETFNQVGPSQVDPFQVGPPQRPRSGSPFPIRTASPARLPNQHGVSAWPFKKWF